MAEHQCNGTLPLDPAHKKDRVVGVSYKTVNVAQEKDINSVLNHFKKMVLIRKENYLLLQVEELASTMKTILPFMRIRVFYTKRKC